MKDRREYRDYLVDVMNAIRDIENFMKGMDFESFAKNREKVFAVIYCLEVIGEAVKKIPDEVREEYQAIPWRKIAGMRDRLIHGYFTVDFERVWESINRDLPPLKDAVTEILKEI